MMPPLNTFDKTLISIALAQATLVSHAATITVSENCSLADAIRSANQSTSIGTCTAGTGGVNTIELPADEIITLSAIALDGDLFSPGGLPVVESNITIQGNGATIERDSGVSTPAFRLFGVSGYSATLTLNSITLQNGLAANDPGSGGYGGAIYFSSGADVFINDSTLSGNSSEGYGGAIYGYSAHILEINRSELSNNSTAYKGGAISSSFRTSAPTAGLKIYNSLLSHNVAGDGYPGGAISLYGGLVNVIANSTVSKNTAAGGGGIYLNAGELEMINATVSNNINTGYAGSLAVAGNSEYPPQVSLLNTVIANGSNNVDCSSNYSLTVTATASWVENIESGCTGGGAVPAGITEGDPKLGPLANNGGTTKAQAPQLDSGLLGAGDATICADPPINGIDQLMVARGVSSCTIGAMETGVDDDATFVVPLRSGGGVTFTL